MARIESRYLKIRPCIAGRKRVGWTSPPPILRHKDNPRLFWRKLAKMAEVEGVDSVATHASGRCQVQSVINQASRPAFFGALLEDVSILFRIERDDFEVGQYIFSQQLPRLTGIDGWGKGRAGQHGKKLSEPMRADMTLEFLATHLPQQSRCLGMMDMVRNRRGNQNGCIQVDLHRPTMSFIRSSSTLSVSRSQSKPRGALPVCTRTPFFLSKEGR